MKKICTMIALVSMFSFSVPSSSHAQSNNDQQIMLLMQVVTLLQAQLATLQSNLSTTVSPEIVQYDDFSISYVNTLTTAWSGQGFFDGEKLFVVEVDIKNTTNKPQEISVDSFVIKNEEGIPFLPIRSSAIKGQPRVTEGTGMSSLGTNRPEITTMTLAKNQEFKGMMVFYVAEEPAGQYTIEYDGEVTDLKSF